ncbi:MAG: hypothetical protein WCX71_05635 [Candidatus Buchananbacteria bacterium]
MADKKEEKLSSKSKLLLTFINYNTLLTVGLVVLIFVLAYFIVLKPKYQAIAANSNDNITYLQSEKNKRQSYLTQLKDISSRFHQINQEEISRLKITLPNNSDIAGLFVQFQELATQNKLALSNISFSETAPAQTENSESAGTDQILTRVKKLNVSLNLVGTGQGSYGELKNFLAALENNLRLFDIQAVYFTPNSPNYAINLITYYLSQ